MTKHIGIVAGSSEGAALCYRTICREALALVGRPRSPVAAEGPARHPLEVVVWAEEEGAAYGRSLSGSRAVTEDGKLDVKLTTPKELGGPGGDLFYAAIGPRIGPEANLSLPQIHHQQCQVRWINAADACCLPEIRGPDAA